MSCQDRISRISEIPREDLLWKDMDCQPPKAPNQPRDRLTDGYTGSFISNV